MKWKKISKEFFYTAFSSSIQISVAKGGNGWHWYIEAAAGYETEWLAGDEASSLEEAKAAALNGMRLILAETAKELDELASIAFSLYRREEEVNADTLADK